MKADELDARVPLEKAEVAGFAGATLRPASDLCLDRIGGRLHEEASVDDAA